MSASPSPPRRVAFCDDAEGFGTLLTFWFEEMAAVELVGATQSFAELEALLASTPVDAVLLDLVLPGMRMDAASVARARELAPGAKVILMSSLPADALRERGEELGADASWSKGAGADVLEALLA